LPLPSPRLWGPDSPHLYCVRSVLTEVDGTVVDVDEMIFGIRRLQLDTTHGVRINGVPLNLRGACIVEWSCWPLHVPSLAGGVEHKMEGANAAVVPAQTKNRVPSAGER